MMTRLLLLAAVAAPSVAVGAEPAYRVLAAAHVLGTPPGTIR
jgi:hypothetical protein